MSKVREEEEETAKQLLLGGKKPSDNQDSGGTEAAATDPMFKGRSVLAESNCFTRIFFSWARPFLTVSLQAD